MREYPFAESLGRKWRFDFAWPKERIAVEIEGGGGANSRHRSMSGFREDCHKYNAAAMLGWTLLRGDAEMVKRRHLLTYLRDALRRQPPSLVPKQHGKRIVYIVNPDNDPWSRPTSFLTSPDPTRLPTGPANSGPSSGDTPSSGPHG